MNFTGKHNKGTDTLAVSKIFFLGKDFFPEANQLEENLPIPWLTLFKYDEGAFGLTAEFEKVTAINAKEEYLK